METGEIDPEEIALSASALAPNQEVDYSVKWLVMAAVGMGVFLATIDGSIVNIALPTLERAFQTDFATLQWVVLVYLVMITTLMLSVGRLADMIGKKKIYATGFVIFTVGSVLCGLSPTIYWLIGFRILQAVGAAMVMALGTAIITEAFPPHEWGRALGITGSIVSVGIVIGPTLGGLILESFSWHWIFFVNLPVGIVGTWMVLRYVPAIKPKEKQRFDFLGALVLLASLLCLLLGMTIGQGRGFDDLLVLGLLAGSVILGVIFVRVELRASQPMVDLKLFRDRMFSVNLLTALMVFISSAGTVILMPFYLENVLGYDPRQVGLMLAVVPVMLGISSPISGVATDRYGTRRIATLGLVLLFIGYMSLRSLSTDTTALGYALRFVPIGLGFGTFQSPNNTAIMAAAPRQQMGVVSGMIAISRTLGQVIGIAILGAVWASLVVSHAGTPVPGGATEAPPALQVAALQDTFLIVSVIIAIAVALSVWGMLTAEKEK
jgi:EmrB/QacA subfamily drug resistance transporter